MPLVTPSGTLVVVLLALISIPGTMAQNKTQIVGALKPSEQIPTGTLCDTLGDLTGSVDDIRQYFLSGVTPEIDEATCYAQCLADPTCKSLGVFKEPNRSTFDGCLLFNATLETLGVKRTQDSSIRFSARSCLASSKRSIDPPSTACTHNSGDLFALRISAPASDLRNGYWASTSADLIAELHPFSDAPILYWESDRTAYFTLNGTGALSLVTSTSTVTRIASYSGTLPHTNIYFSLLEQYDPDGRKAIPLKCKVTNGKLMCADGDPMLTSPAESFDFALCTSKRNTFQAGVPTTITQLFPGLITGSLKSLCDVELIKVNLVPYYACF